jgi:hypothetical protein
MPFLALGAKKTLARTGLLFDNQTGGTGMKGNGKLGVLQGFKTRLQKVAKERLRERLNGVCPTDLQEGEYGLEPVGAAEVTQDIYNTVEEVCLDKGLSEMARGCCLTALAYYQYVIHLRKDGDMISARFLTNVVNEHLIMFLKESGLQQKDIKGGEDA